MSSYYKRTKEQGQIEFSFIVIGENVSVQLDKHEVIRIPFIELFELMAETAQDLKPSKQPAIKRRVRALLIGGQLATLL